MACTEAFSQLRKIQEETLEHHVHALYDVSFFYQTPPHSISICIYLLWFESILATKGSNCTHLPECNPYQNQNT